MKARTCILFILMLSLCSLSNGDEIKDPVAGKDNGDVEKIELTKEAYSFYNRLARQAWSYGAELIEGSVEGDKMIALSVKQDLAAASFQYYVSVIEGVIARDQALEDVMRPIIKNYGIMDVWNDPLNWYGEGLRRGIGLETWRFSRVSDAEYKTHVENYKKYFSPD